jgi:hypothetical protein
MAQELKALDLSDEDLNRLSEITEQDIIISNRLIAKALDKRFKNLLLAIDSELAKLEEGNANTS